MVHFYDTEDDLVGLVGSYLAASVLDGDDVVVIATPEHHRGLVAAMTGAGVDIEVVERAGRLVLLDADETLSQFMSGKLPDAEAFDSVVGSVVRRAAASGRPIRAYGEMVARLWAEGNPGGAVELERLWNLLGEHTPLGLFCAYPRSVISPVDAEDAFGEVCSLHSSVVAGAPMPPAESSRRFLAGPGAPRLARLYVAATLAAWQMDGLSDDVVIAVGELAANAVTHAGGDFTVGLQRLPGRLRLIVGDTAPVAVFPGRAPRMASGGRGLAMVAALAGAWGFDLQDGGKTVWADFPDVPR